MESKDQDRNAIAMTEKKSAQRRLRREKRISSFGARLKARHGATKRDRGFPEEHEQLAEVQAISHDHSSRTIKDEDLPNSEHDVDTVPSQSPPALVKTPSKRITARHSSHFPSPPRPSPSPSPVKRNKSRSSSGKKPINHVIQLPQLSCPRFGLIQEHLATSPFQLLLAVILLNQTTGRAAIPTLFRVLDLWPDPTAMAAADPTDIEAAITHLGFGKQRTSTFRALAQTWLAHPPTRNRRCRTLHYPQHSDGLDIKQDEVLGDDDPRGGALEIAHLPGCGAYAFDSWRIFCRDVLRGVATGWNGEGSIDPTSAAHVEEETSTRFEPEWKRTLPHDKELRAFLAWMWLKEGWLWDATTGERRLADTALREAASQGRLWRDLATGTVQTALREGDEVVSLKYV